jgi:hypothetical protein
MIARSTARPFDASMLAGPVLARPAPEFRISTERLRCLLLWLTGASGAIVFIEPSPYEVVSFLSLAIFAIGGLTLSAALMPLSVLLVLINVGYSVSGWTVIDDQGIAMWLLTSWYLAVTALFFAAVVGVNTEARLNALTRGCIIGGVVASLAAIIGYSRVFSSLNDLLLLYDRARGTFKDPNVLGAFLVFPTLLALQPVIAGRLREAAKGVMLLGLFVPAILLSFSRAAWGQIVYTALVMLALTFLTTRSPSQRVRIVRCCRSTRSPTCSSSARASSRATTWAPRAASRATRLAPFSRSTSRSASGHCNSASFSRRIRTTPSSTPSCRAAGSPAHAIRR